MMEQKKVDRRVAKTKRAIYNAIAKLLNEREVEDITIRDIVDIADINRKTFYNYYPGIYALLDEVENCIVQTFETALGETDFKEAINNPIVVYESLNKILNSDLEFYGHLISMKGNANLISKTVDLLKEKTRKAVILQLPHFEDKADTILDFIFSGMLAVYQRWFLSKNRPPIESVSETISLLCYGGVNSVMKSPGLQAMG